ncbi:MAG: hypothetical protein M3R25_02515 [Bacteroidota bacterium]|nr:hypothetical protein [Bacteroidota bacterium]
MRDSKLYKALVLLSGHEVNRLQRFIYSPYFNRNSALTKFFDWVKEDLKSKDPIAEKKYIWELAYPGEKYDDGRFRKLQSDLLKLIEAYYAQEAFESNPIHKARYLLDSINSNRLEHLENTAIKSAAKFADGQLHMPAIYYYYQYEVEQSSYGFNRHKTDRGSKSNIELIVKNLDRFYLAEKLRYYSSILTHQHFVAVNYKMLFIDEIIAHVKNNDYDDVPPILIYYQIILTSLDPQNREHYELLKNYFEKYIQLFPEAEAKDILDAMLNYCIIRMNAGDEEYVREAFNLYKQSLLSKLLFVKGHITPWSFKNIITIGLRLKEFSWIEDFIIQGESLLEEKFRGNAITFNLAQLYFYRKEYAKVIQQLSKVEYDDFTYNLNSKTLLMASFYELDEFEALNSFLASFRLYIVRNKNLTKGKGKHYNNTISIVRRLIKLDTSKIAEIEKLTKEVTETQGIVSKNWILEKLAKLRS